MFLITFYLYSCCLLIWDPSTPGWYQFSFLTLIRSFLVCLCTSIGCIYQLRVRYITYIFFLIFLIYLRLGLCNIVFDLLILLFSKFLLQRPQLVKGNMQLFSVDQQRSQALEAHAASFATFKVWFCHSYVVYFCLFWVVYLISLINTGCREWESFNSYLFCIQELQCWTSCFKDAYYWTWCPARLADLLLANPLVINALGPSTSTKMTIFPSPYLYFI